MQDPRPQHTASRWLPARRGAIGSGLPAGRLCNEHQYAPVPLGAHCQAIRSAIGRLAGVALTGLVVAGLTGCGTGAAAPDPGAAGPASAVPASAAPAGSTAAGAEHNVVDFYFAQRMLPHHAQAVRMTELAPDRASDDAVAQLAAEIGETLGGEAVSLEEWLTERDLEQPPPEAFADGHPSHAGMPGMLNALQMNLLADVSGAEFDETFLTFMIAHHEGSVAMAAPVLENGLDPAARELATTITERQEDELEAMRDLLGDD